MRRLPTLASLLSAAAILFIGADASAAVPPPPSGVDPAPAPAPAPTPEPAPATGQAGASGEVGGSIGGSAAAVPPAPAPEPEPVPIEEDPEPAPEPPVGDGTHGAGPGSGAMGGKFGLGVIRTVAGVTGINARYFASDKVSLGVNFGLATHTYKEPDPDDAPDGYRRRNVAALGMSLEMLYWAGIGQPAGNLPFRADFGIGGRLGFTHVVNATDIGDNLDDPLELIVEVPMAMHLMFGENFAIVPEFGAALRWIPGDPEPNADGDFDTNPGQNPPLAAGGPGPGLSFQMGNDGAFGLFMGGGMEYYF